jgi:hypothetical protein
MATINNPEIASIGNDFNIQTIVTLSTTNFTDLGSTNLFFKS